MTEIITFKGQENSAQDKDYVFPALDKGAFNCPHCQALAAQEWKYLGYIEIYGDPNMPDQEFTVAQVNKDEEEGGLKISYCYNCNQCCIWRDGQRIYPDTGNAPPPNQDLSPTIKKIYEEAASIMQKSPRAAAALLRLAIEELCKSQNCEGANLEAKINNLAKKNAELQEVVNAMHAVRFVGNKGIHTGTIQLSDTPEIVAGMFELINFAAAQLISAPKRRKNIIDRVNQLREKPQTKDK